MKRNGPWRLEAVYSPISLRDLTLGVMDAIKEIESVDIMAFKHCERPLDDLDELRYFRETFKNMFEIVCSEDPNVRRKKQSAPPVETPVARSGAPKRVAPAVPLQESKRNKRETSSNRRPKTPDEDNAEMLLRAFLDNVLSIVRSEVRRLEWVGNEYQVEITKGYSFSIRSLISRHKGRSRVKLGWEVVGIKNDGGIAINLLGGGCWTRFQPGRHMPVLSLEVFLFCCFLLISG
jgi:hypothetical protein